MRERPDWWPETPYPESVFPMTNDEYVKAIPDEMLRTRISGFLYREGWKVADRMIFERWSEDAGDMSNATARICDALDAHALTVAGAIVHQAIAEHGGIANGFDQGIEVSAKVARALHAAARRIEHAR